MVPENKLKVNICQEIKKLISKKLNNQSIEIIGHWSNIYLLTLCWWFNFIRILWSLDSAKAGGHWHASLIFWCLGCFISWLVTGLLRQGNGTHSRGELLVILIILATVVLVVPCSGFIKWIFNHRKYFTSSSVVLIFLQETHSQQELKICNFTLYSL